MNNLEFDNYFVEIEGHFAHRRGRATIVSPLDWALIGQWQTRGIPLRVVLAAMDDVFNRCKSDGAINSLSYCENAINTAFKQWSENRAGAQDDASDGGAAAVTPEDERGEVVMALEQIVSQLDALCRRTADIVPKDVFVVFTETRREVTHLSKEYAEHTSFDRTEMELEQLELTFLLALSQAVPSETKEKFFSEIQATFKPTMPTEQRAKTAKILLANQIRAYFNAPKLTIFQ